MCVYCIKIFRKRSFITWFALYLGTILRHLFRGGPLQKTEGNQFRWITKHAGFNKEGLDLPEPCEWHLSILTAQLAPFSLTRAQLRDWGNSHDPFSLWARRGHCSCFVILERRKSPSQNFFLCCFSEYFFKTTASDPICLP